MPSEWCASWSVEDPDLSSSIGSFSSRGDPQVFPRSKLEAEMLLDAFKAVLDKETREDLKLNLTSYMSWLDSESKKPNNDR